jgi:hypothetical protein
MRTKNEHRFVASDLLKITGVPLGSRLAQRLLNALKPDRPRSHGVAIEITVPDIAKAFLILQMWNGGVSHELASETCSMIHKWIYRDRIAQPDSEAGLVMILRDVNGEALGTRYIPRADWDAKGWEAVRASFTKPLLEPYVGPLTAGARAHHALTNYEPLEPSLEPSLWEKDPRELGSLTPTSFLLFDLRAIFEDAQLRVDKFCEKAAVVLSVDDLLDAYTVASQVRDQVDSIEREDQESE